jgi:hypothetical protein
MTEVCSCLASHPWEICVMHLERPSGISSEKSGSCLVIAEFENSDDGELFYLTNVCHVRRYFVARVGCRGGVVG